MCTHADVCMETSTTLQGKIRFYLHILAKALPRHCLPVCFAQLLTCSLANMHTHTRTHKYTYTHLPGSMITSIGQVSTRKASPSLFLASKAFCGNASQGISAEKSMSIISNSFPVITFLFRDLCAVHTSHEKHLFAVKGKGCPRHENATTNMGMQSSKESFERLHRNFMLKRCYRVHCLEEP